MAKSNNEPLQILSLPKLINSGLGPARYPLYYKDNNNASLPISAPVGFLTCPPLCYTDIKDIAVIDGKCRRCHQPVTPKERFLDVGLMNLIVKHRNEIDANKPYYIEYDG